MNSVTINSKTYKDSTNIVINNGRVTINGKKIDLGEVDSGILEVKVTGTLENLETDCSVTCEDVTGDVQAGGSVTCDNVGGDVQAGGSVTCDNITGSVMAGGSIRHG